MSSIVAADCRDFSHFTIKGNAQEYKRIRPIYMLDTTGNGGF